MRSVIEDWGLGSVIGIKDYKSAAIRSVVSSLLGRGLRIFQPYYGAQGLPEDTYPFKKVEGGQPATLPVSNGGPTHQAPSYNAPDTLHYNGNGKENGKFKTGADATEPATPKPFTQGVPVDPDEELYSPYRHLFKK
jgi:hypothetical protein